MNSYKAIFSPLYNGSGLYKYSDLNFPLFCRKEMILLKLIFICEEDLVFLIIPWIFSPLYEFYHVLLIL